MTGTSLAQNMQKTNNGLDELTERKRLMERDAEWAAIASEGRDIDRILSYWTDDAIILPPAFAQVMGKAALRNYVENSLRIPGFKITWKSTDVKFSPDLNLAYMFGENAVSINGPDGTPVTTKGRAVTIWRRERDGIWRCAVDIWNDAQRTEAPS
jgi:ketosteroid isomerase-like protein